jgi:hypothetical protein
LFADFPDISMEDEDLVMTGNRVVLTATITATDVSGRLTAPGARLRLPMVVLYTLQGTRIARERRIWDFSGILLRRVQKDLKTAAEVQQILLRQPVYRPGSRLRQRPCRRDLGGDFRLFRAAGWCVRVFSRGRGRQGTTGIALERVDSGRARRARSIGRGGGDARQSQPGDAPASRTGPICDGCLRRLVERRPADLQQRRSQPAVARRRIRPALARARRHD